MGIYCVIYEYDREGVIASGAADDAIRLFVENQDGSVIPNPYILLLFLSLSLFKFKAMVNCLIQFVHILLGPFYKLHSMLQRFIILVLLLLLLFGFTCIKGLQSMHKKAEEITRGIYRPKSTGHIYNNNRILRYELIHTGHISPITHSLRLASVFTMELANLGIQLNEMFNWDAKA